MSHSMCTLSLTLHGTDTRQVVAMAVSGLVIAGWTGRDLDGLEAHIRELEQLGVARPRQVPMFYRCGAALLTVSSLVEVAGKDSTGEVECVLFTREDGLWVGVGSDHTDRRLEASSVTLSKQVCPKPVAPEAWRFKDVEPHWDELVLRSYTSIDGRRDLYQEGAVSRMRHPTDLLAIHDERDASSRIAAGTVMFCGTLPVRGGIRWGDAFTVELEDPVLGRRITHTYAMRALPIEG
jgi:hypothetical protein